MRVSGPQSRSSCFGGEKKRLLYVHFVNLTMQYSDNVIFICGQTLEPIWCRALNSSVIFEDSAICRNIFLTLGACVSSSVCWWQISLLYRLMYTINRTHCSYYEIQSKPTFIREHGIHHFIVRAVDTDQLMLQIYSFFVVLWNCVVMKLIARVYFAGDNISWLFTGSWRQIQRDWTTSY
jgi:hypothetical protein